MSRPLTAAEVIKGYRIQVDQISVFAKAANTWGLVEGLWGLWTEVGRDTFRVSCLRMYCIGTQVFCITIVHDLWVYAGEGFRYVCGSGSVVCNEYY